MKLMKMNLEKNIAAIRKYNQAGNFAESEKLLMSLISDEKNKDNIRIILEMGQLFYGLNNFDKARKYFSKALKIDKSNIYASAGMCRCMIASGKYLKLQKNINIIKRTTNKKLKIKIITQIIQEIFYNKIFNKNFMDTNDEKLLNIIKNNINAIEKKEKTRIVRDISLYCRQHNKENQVQSLLESIIMKDPYNHEINVLYLNSLTVQKKYRQAYKLLNSLKIKNKILIKNDIVNNLIKMNIDNKDGLEGLDADLMLSFYFKLKKIKYLQNDSYFIEKLNSLLRKILVFIRQQNYKIENSIYRKILKKINKNDFNIHNSLINEIEWGRKKIILASKPRVAQIMVTDKCNSKCNMCDIGNKHKWELNVNGFKNVSKLLKYLDSVTWQGGEVQFYDKFAELVSLARKYNVSQLIITNGINWNEHVLKKIISGDISIAVSVDAFDKKTYEYIRGIDGFDRVQKFIQMVNRNKTDQNKLKLYTTIMNSNIGQMNQIAKFAKDNKIDEVVLSPLKKLQDNDFFYKENVFFKKDGVKLADYNDKIKNVNKNLEYLRKELSDNNIKFVSFIPEISEKQIIKINDSSVESCAVNEKNDDFCYAPWKYIAVTEKGFIVPSFSCGQPMILGDINSNDIFKIWNAKKMRSVRKDIINSCAEKWCGTCKSVNC